MKKAKRNTATAAFSDVIPTVLDPKLYKKIETLCTSALKLCGNHAEVRAAIASLNLEMRQDANKSHGQVTIDVTSLSQLLKRTDPNKPQTHMAPEPTRDPIDVLELTKKLTPAEVSAAEVIRDMWKAFGRCLTVSGRGYDRGGGSRGQILHPLDVMGDDTWETYQDLYLPWFKTSRLKIIGGKVTGNTTAFAIVHHIVVDEYFPSAVDKFLALDEGTALKVLRTELGRFFNDHTLATLPMVNAGGRGRVRVSDCMTEMAAAA